MAEPNLNGYIFVTRKNFLSDDNEGRMVEKIFLKIQGTFLVKIRDNTFNGTIGENAIKYSQSSWPLKTKGVSQDRFRLSVFPISLAGTTGEWFKKDCIGTYEEHEYELNNNITRDLEEPWSEYGVPYQLCDHICKPYRYKNRMVKWPTCSADIDRFCNGGELPRMVRVGCMTYLQNHQWYDELTDGVLKEEALMHKTRFEGSWGYATPEVMKFCAWLKNSF
ncbi:hypothetical protein Tco_1242264 [Tanacetum coccineum]